MAHDSGALLQRVCLHSPRRKPCFKDQAYFQPHGCLGADRTLARSRIQLHHMGTYVLCTAGHRKALHAEDLRHGSHTGTYIHTGTDTGELGYIHHQRP